MHAFYSRIFVARWPRPRFLAGDRLKDLADVQELIKIRGLQPEFASQLDPYVREKFLELYETVKQSPKD